MTQHLQRRRSQRARARGVSAAPMDGTPVALDLLRGELYRMLDEIARAHGESHRNLVLQFEIAWELYKRATAAVR